MEIFRVMQKKHDSLSKPPYILHIPIKLGHSNYHLTGHSSLILRTVMPSPQQRLFKQQNCKPTENTAAIYMGVWIKERCHFAPPSSFLHE